MTADSRAEFDVDLTAGLDGDSESLGDLVDRRAENGEVFDL